MPATIVEHREARRIIKELQLALTPLLEDDERPVAEQRRHWDEIIRPYLAEARRNKRPYDYLIMDYMRALGAETDQAARQRFVVPPPGHPALLEEFD